MGCPSGEQSTGDANTESHRVWLPTCGLKWDMRLDYSLSSALMALRVPFGRGRRKNAALHTRAGAISPDLARLEAKGATFSGQCRRSG